jgi:hypothetical protein
VELSLTYFNGCAPLPAAAGQVYDAKHYREKPMTKRLCFFWLSVLLLSPLFAAPALAQSPLPTDTELRAAYCIRVIQNDIRLFNDALAQIDKMTERIQEVPEDMRQQALELNQKTKAELPRTIANRESVLNRLQMFIVPRMKYLDSSALLAATNRADSDIEEWSRVMSECTTKCTRPPATTDKLDACLGECRSSDLSNRLEACRNPTWLPF